MSPKGPAGGPRPFVSDKKTIIVLIGIDGPEPPKDVALDTEKAVNSEINIALKNAGADIDMTRQTVSLTTEENPTRKQRAELGMDTLSVQQYDVSTELEEVSKGIVDAVHNTVVDEVTDLGYNITDTKTTVI